MTHILIIAPAWVGDAVISQALFKQLKNQDASVCIDVLAPSWTSSVFAHMPEVRHIHESTLQHGALQLNQRYRFGKYLRQYNYDQAIILPNSLKSALIPWLARIPRRTGFLGEYRYGLLNDIPDMKSDAIKPYAMKRLVDRFVFLGMDTRLNRFPPEPFPFPKLMAMPSETLFAMLNKHEHAYKISLQQPILALCVGAAFGDAKCWPTHHFAQVARYQLEKGWAVWLLGSQADHQRASTINALTQEQCNNVAGKLTLSETINLLSLANGVITNDSGLMHIAAALGRPLIAVYGPTSPEITPPLSSNAIVLTHPIDCQPCFQRTCPKQHHRCLRELSPERVLSAMSPWHDHHAHFTD